MAKTREELLIKRWYDNGAEPKDLTTLSMNILLYKLNHCLSLDTKLVMSSTGNHIFIMIKADDSDIERFAEESHY